MKIILFIILLFSIVSIGLILFKSIRNPQYAYHPGNPFNQEPDVRCLCFGYVRTIVNPAADPSVRDACMGFEEKGSCKLQTSTGWSESAYRQKYSEK